MCYSAKVWSDYRKYVKLFGAHVSMQEFFALLERRFNGEKISLPKALTDAFKHGTPASEEEARCRELVLAYEAAETGRLEEQLFAQRRRLADAERALAVKPTKKASEEQRIAGNKIAWLRGKLDDLRRTQYEERDDRIFPGYFCPVLTMEPDGRYVVRPMRYLCRPAGKPAFHDTRYPGLYNARRDNLTGFWKDVYASTHAVLIAEAFYEHVNRHRMEGRELAPGEQAEDVVLEFAPGDGQLMHLACLWSHWTGKGEPDLDSFAIITDEPPAEVAAAGHDRCPIPLKPGNLPAWLGAPARTNFQALLDDRERPYYAHRLAA